MKTIIIILLLVTVLGGPSQLQAQWTVQHSGLPYTQHPTLLFSIVDTNICWGVQSEITNPQGVRTTDGGDHWTAVQLPNANNLYAVSVSAVNKDTAWITLDDRDGTSAGGIFKTIDGGITWVKQETAFPGAGGHPRKLYFFDSLTGLCTGLPRNGYWEIYTTTDGGTNWVRVPSANIPAPAPDDLTGHGAGAGSSFWFNTASCSVYRTIDKGLTWSVTRNIFPSYAYFLELAFKDEMNGLACSYYGDETNKIARTSDGGVTWTKFPANQSPPSAAGIAYVPGTIGTYFVTSMQNIGLPEPAVAGSVYTTDGGVTWTPVDQLSHGETSFINNRTGWSAGSGDTIFKWKSSIPLGVGNIGQPGTTFTLSQNYPNPFTASTSIRFRIPQTSMVNLKVYDIRGAEVATLEDDEKAAGSYEVIFETRGLQAGIYYYTLRVGKTAQTKMLCVL